jgi:thioredoxin reductase (NADPH)
MMSVYPDKDVYNFPGIPLIRGRDLINDLVYKAIKHGAATRLGEYVRQISHGINGTLVIETEKNSYLSSAVIMTTGTKAYLSALSSYFHVENWDGSCVYESWPPPNLIQDRSIALICGSIERLQIPGDLKAIPARIYLIFDCDIADQQLSDIGLPDSQTINSYRKPWRLKEITGHGIPQSVILSNSKTGEERAVDIDMVIGLYENQTRQTLYSNWGIEMAGQHIKVDQRMLTSVKNIYAAGDIVWYPGKVKLLSEGVKEARTAVKNALKNI